jgi:hypothetical protein
MFYQKGLPLTVWVLPQWGNLKTVSPNLALKFNSSTTVQLTTSAPIAAIPC